MEDPPVFCLVCLFLILPIEFLYPTRSINKQFFTGVEGVRSRGHLDLDQRVFVAIFPFDGIFGSHCRPGQESKIARRILKYYFFILRMDIFFHVFTFSIPQKRHKVKD